MSDRICARDLQPGMVVSAKSMKGQVTYLILDIHRTPDGRYRTWVHILGHPKPLTFAIFLQPNTEYFLNSCVIKEAPA